MEKTLRYLLIAVTVLSVLSLSAQTHQYVTTHYSGHEQTISTGVHVNPQMPAANMDWHSEYMTSGSHLPQAAVEGTTTTYDTENSSGTHKTGPRKVSDDDSPGTEPGQENPIGDAAWPLALLALAYLIIRVRRAKGDRTA